MARNNRSCFLAFTRVEHLEKTRPLLSFTTCQQLRRVRRRMEYGIIDI
jgi:hypothetical protein